MEAILSEKDLIQILENLINQIPKGKITTYKEMALAIGSIYATRFIYNAIRKINGPWWRVVNEKGEIKDKKHLELLKKEGITIENNKIINLTKYLYRDLKIDHKPLERLRRYQIELSKKISLYDDFSDINIIGGVDLSYKNNKAIVVYTLLDIEKLKLLKFYVFEEHVSFPYIPTFLSFREGDPILKTFNRVEPKPNVLFVNGQGIAHPVKMGLASYIGVVLDIPTVGITKKHLYGEIKENKIYDKDGNQIGWVIKKNGKTVYVSPGNKLSLESSKELAEKTWIKGQYPEPIRIADEISKKVKKRNNSLLDYLK